MSDLEALQAEIQQVKSARAEALQGEQRALTLLAAWQQSLEGRGIGLVIVEQLSWGGGLLQSRGLARVGATRQ